MKYVIIKGSIWKTKPCLPFPGELVVKDFSNDVVEYFFISGKGLQQNGKDGVFRLSSKEFLEIYYSFIRIELMSLRNKIATIKRAL